MRNAFYTQVGKHISPGQEILSNLKATMHTIEPDAILGSAKL
jgi:hypothetical protein